MTMESRQPEGTGSNADLVRSAALSSADLWHEILERLNEVQEGQLRLARAIESLGKIVCDALSVNPQSALQGGEATSLARTPARVSLAAGPQTPAAGHAVNDGRDLVATQRTIDSLLGADVFTPASSPADVGHGADIAAVAPAGSATSPRFYVAPVAQEERRDAREPVSSGSWPRGRRVARGLARQAPPMAAPAIVPDLTPAAIDALLAAEFGDAADASGPRPKAVPAAEGGALLTALLGAEFDVLAPPTTAVDQSEVPVPPPPVAERPPSPPTPSPSPLPPSSMPTPVPPPQAVTTASPLSPAPASPVVASPVVASPVVASPVVASPVVASPVVAPRTAPWTPTTDPRRSVSEPAATVAPATPPVAPRPNPTGGPTPLLPPPGPPSTPPMPPAPSVAPGTPGAPARLGTMVPPNPAAVPANPAAVPANPAVGPNTSDPASTTPFESRRPPLGPVTNDPAPFMASAGPAAQDEAPPGPGSPPGPGPNAPEMSTPTKPGQSAASMATEILSAAPSAPVTEPVAPTPSIMAEDVTIMARGRRRRFRLR